MAGSQTKLGTACLSALLALAASVWPRVPDAGQIPSAAYFLLQPGMSEGEVLVRAGPPDLVTPASPVVACRVCTHADNAHPRMMERRKACLVLIEWLSSSGAAPSPDREPQLPLLARRW